MSTHEVLPSLSAEQASMLTFDSVDTAMQIKNFTWSKIENRVAELVDNHRLKTNDAGNQQKLPFRIPKEERPQRGPVDQQLEEIVVIAISCNIYAVQLGLPCKLVWSTFVNVADPYTVQFRYSYRAGRYADDPQQIELYMAKKAWTQNEMVSWSMSPAFRRKHLCSLEGGWNWGGCRIFRVPFVPYLRPKLQPSPLPAPTNGMYKIRLRRYPMNLRYLDLIDSHFHLRLEPYEDPLGFALLLLQPKELVTGTPSNGLLYDIVGKEGDYLVGVVPEVRRCTEVRTLVDTLKDVFEGGSLATTALEDWGPIRDSSVSGRGSLD